MQSFKVGDKIVCIRYYGYVDSFDEMCEQLKRGEKPRPSINNPNIGKIYTVRRILQQWEDLYYIDTKENKELFSNEVIKLSKVTPVDVIPD
jgi:hypothetical protein